LSAVGGGGGTRRTRGQRLFARSPALRAIRRPTMSRNLPPGSMTTAGNPRSARVARGKPAARRRRRVSSFQSAEVISKGNISAKHHPSPATRATGGGTHRRGGRTRRWLYREGWPTRVVIIPTISADTVTPHTEAFQAVVLAPGRFAPCAQAARDEMGSRYCERRPSSVPRPRRPYSTVNVFNGRDRHL